jgi:hypothetical protein
MEQRLKSPYVSENLFIQMVNPLATGPVFGTPKKRGQDFFKQS